MLSTNYSNKILNLILCSILCKLFFQFLQKIYLQKDFDVHVKTYMSEENKLGRNFNDSPEK